MQKTFLYQNHVDLNAKMVDFAGWMMPIQYNNLKEEVKAVRENVGVFDVSHMGEFFVTGPEALKFVDFMVTNDIATAPLNKAIYSPLCRDNGTVIDDLIVYKLKSDFIMICVNASNIDKDFQWFDSHKQNFNVKLENKSNDYSLLAVQGPNAYHVLKEISLTQNIEDIPYYSLQLVDNSSTPIIYARTGYTGEDGFEIFGPHEFIKKLWQMLVESKVTPCGLGARDVLRLEVGYPLYGHELNDEITPLDAGLRWTVKLKKSSFIGKDALAAYSPKFELIKLSLDKGIPREGYNVLNAQGEIIGTVTSGTMSVVLNKGIAMARVDKNLYNQNQSIFIDIRNKQYEAVLETKAFVSGGHK
jgi:aminomethyltransferase